MICCGTELVTPFCPECGKRSEDPLLHLLRHLRTQLASHEEVRDARRRDLAEHSAAPEHERAFLKRRLDCAEKTAVKWRQWVEALQKLLAGGAA